MNIAHPTLDELRVNTIRTLSMDAVQKAQSGHPGTPMEAAPTEYCLWQRFLAFDPHDPDWPNRDRFVLSATLPCCSQRAAFVRCQDDEPDVRARRSARRVAQ